MAKDFRFTNVGNVICIKDRADAIVHVATIGEGHDETATWNSEGAGRRINHADRGGGRYRHTKI